MHIENPRWYALHVATRLERTVEIQLQHKGFDALLPTYAVSRQWSDRIKRISLPLFPGYVFCRFPLDNRFPVLGTPGVHGIVGAGKSPIPLGDNEIMTLQDTMESGVRTQPWPYVTEGEEVRVISGPLAGLTGIVVRAQSKLHFIVSIHLLMRSVSVEIEQACLIPIRRDRDGKTA